MKEATGEANMTVVTIILITAIVAIATPIVSNLMKTSEEKACCMNNGGYYQNGGCVDSNGRAVSTVCENK